MLLKRQIEDKVMSKLRSNKVVIIFGPRRVGKTILLKQIIDRFNGPTLLLNGEDFSVQESLERRTVANYKNVIGDKKLLIIDEAQSIKNIGKILKLIVDSIEGLKIIVTGSSAFDLSSNVGEPLTGRKFEFKLLPISELEFSQIENTIEKKEYLKSRLVYGNYPEIIKMTNKVDKVEYLRDLTNSYLLKDLLTYENIRNSDKIYKLLKMIAFQVGNEVSYDELSKKLNLSKNTVTKYLDLLAKSFVLHNLKGYSNNLRKEITKSSKWYFYDNGIRNILVSNMNDLENRNDVGKLWENYIINERLKQQYYNNTLVNNYFWRTYDQQEIDWIEEREGNLFAIEYKWGNNNSIKPPLAWTKNYPNSYFNTITQYNYYNWLNNTETS